MGVYVQHQDKWVFPLVPEAPHTQHVLRAIADLLAPNRGSNSRASLDSHPTADEAEQTTIVVLPSSTELFYVYGQTLEGCATLSTGRPLFDLLEVFKKWLRVYAGEKALTSYQTLFIHSRVCRGSAHVTNAAVSCYFHII
jgi:hypothetical protein